MNEKKTSFLKKEVSRTGIADIFMGIGSLMILLGFVLVLTPRGAGAKILAGFLVVLGALVNIGGFMAKLINGRKKN